MVVKGGFQVPIYDCEVKIIVSSNLVKTINTYLRNNGHKELKLKKGGVTPIAYFFYPGGSSSTYYLMFGFENLTADEINHEKSHLVEEILIGRDIEPKDEVRAFLDGFLSLKIDNFFKRHNDIIYLEQQINKKH